MSLIYKNMIFVLLIVILVSCRTTEFYLEPVDKKDMLILKMSKNERKKFQEYWKKNKSADYKFELHAFCKEKTLVYFSVYWFNLKEIGCK